MHLSKRLQAVADCVTHGSNVADIGCDHAHISIYLVENQIADIVIAMDINKGPLQRAKENIFKYGFENKIETRLSDGAKKLKKGEADTVLISGMGGGLIIKILEESSGILESVKELILQPQSEIEKVRKYLHQIGYHIIKEDMIIEDGKYYVVMKAVKGKEWYTREIFYYYGKLLLESRNPVLKQYLTNGLKNNMEIREKLSQAKTDKSVMRIRELEQEFLCIREGLNCFAADKKE